MKRSWGERSVGIAAEQKMPGTAQRFQDERELHGRYVLDFVDNHEVVRGAALSSHSERSD